MKINNEMVEFLKISQKLSGAEIIITDTEKIVVSLSSGEKDSKENLNISSYIKNFNVGDKKEIYLKDIEKIEVCSDFDTKCKSAIILKLLREEKALGTVIFLNKESNFLSVDLEFAKTARNFIYEFLKK